MFHVEHTAKINTMKSHAILLCSRAKSVTRIYITPSRACDVMQAHIGSEYLTWQRIRIGGTLFMMWHASQHHPFIDGDTAFRVNCDTFRGSAILSPLGKDASELCLRPQEAKKYISQVEKATIFLKKQLDWFPMDLENEASDENFSWVKTPSKKEIMMSR